MNLLAAKNRLQVALTMEGEEFDLLVIGGGITGAGIALDAAARGMKVALLEKKDYAAGTSSKSTKLIHGGLRYLKQLEFGLVMEVGRERAILHRLAPHLVRSKKMLLPIIRGGTFGKTGTGLGLWMYDLLAGVLPEDRRKMLSRRKTLDLEPLLQPDGLIGGGIYAEYQTDDARLTIEVIKTAVRHGALCLNHAEVVDFQYDKNKVTGVTCRMEFPEKEFSVRAKYVVSAAGPWVDILRSRNNSLHGKRLFLSKGVHAVVPLGRLPLRNAVYFDAPDGRMMFAIPRLRTTYIGTTETPFQASPDEVDVQLADIQYILAGANAMFPSAKLEQNDVESGWAGLRPLIYEEGKSAGEMSRKDEIFISDTGLISIAGGKLTGYRKMAQRVVDLVAGKYRRQYGRGFEPSSTDQIPLTAHPFSGMEEVAGFQKNLATDSALKNEAPHRAAYFVENYGKAAAQILDLTKSGLSLAAAELTYCLENEQVVTMEDFLERRTGRLYFDKPSIQKEEEAWVACAEKYFQPFFPIEKEAFLQSISKVLAAKFW